MKFKADLHKWMDKMIAEERGLLIPQLVTPAEYSLLESDVCFFYFMITFISIVLVDCVSTAQSAGGIPLTGPSVPMFLSHFSRSMSVRLVSFYFLYSFFIIEMACILWISIILTHT